MNKAALVLAISAFSVGLCASQETQEPIALAIAARESGDAARALALWEKAVELAPSDGFLVNQKAWSLLALGRVKEAKKAFARAAELSADSAGQAESHFGTGLAQFFDSDLKPSAKTLEGVCQENQYLYPISSAWLAKVAERMRKPDVASLYLKHSLEQDPLHPAALDALGGLYESHHMPREAWQSYREALALNPLDADAAQGVKKVEESMPDPTSLARTRRLRAPLLQRPLAPPPSPALRIGLFSDAAGEPSQLRKIRFVSGAELKLQKAGKTLGAGSPNSTWEASWDPENRVLEIRDPGRKLRYAGRDAVRVEPSEAGSSVLVRDAETPQIHGLDLGDRELRGALELAPAASGFFLINELGVEEYLFSQLAAFSPSGAPAEELKAQAVAMRSSMEGLRRRFARAEPKTDLCDSAHCQLYRGLGQERSDSTAAVLATAGERLYFSSATTVSVHGHCGGVTEEGIVDASTGTAPSRSGEALDRFLHADPVKENFCNVSPIPPAPWARWVRVLEPRQLEQALQDRARIGRLRAFKVTARTASGRVSGLEIAGADGRWSPRDEEDLTAVLLRLGLRSSLFAVQPLFHDKDLAYVVVWGSGSGDGRGMCIAGALGQAYQGRDYKTILLHYFPGAELR